RLRQCNTTAAGVERLSQLCCVGLRMLSETESHSGFMSATSPASHTGVSLTSVNFHPAGVRFKLQSYQPPAVQCSVGAPETCTACKYDRVLAESPSMTITWLLLMW